MKLKIFYIVCILSLLAPKIAWVEVQLPNGKEIIQNMESVIRGNTNYGVYSMTVVTPRWERTLTLEAWDDHQNNRAFIKILAPAKDKDTLFLKIGYQLWMFMPKLERIIKIPPSMMLQPWMGSDFTNDDLAKESSIVNDYTHHVVGVERVEDQEVYKIELIPKPEAPIVWGKIWYWINKKNFLPLREQFFDEKGKLIKDLRFSEIKSMDDRDIPTLYEMRSVNKPGHITTLRIEKILFDQKFDERIFSIQRLKKAR